jgi:hypothetical protein
VNTDAANTFYVSPAGNDQWSGRLPEPDKAGGDGPYATLGRAVAAVRSRADRATAAAVVLRGGNFFFEEPFILRPEDSGTVFAPVTYRAYSGELLVISAGARLTNWEDTHVNGRRAWVCNAPHWPFHQLWINGQRRLRPRLPKQGVYRVKSASPAESFYRGQKEFYADTDQVHAWHHLRDVDVVVMTTWADSRLPVESVDEASGRVTTTLYSTLAIRADPSYRSRFYIDNVFEALDEPGLWYHERTSGKVFYLPLPGEDMATVEAIVPRHRAALTMGGDPDGGGFVEHLRFEGIAFAHSEWWRTSTTPISYWEIQDDPSKHLRHIEVRQAVDDRAADMQCAVSVTGVVEAIGSRHCRFSRCTVAHAGNYGIELGRGSSHNEIASCAFYDLGGGGVKLGTEFVADAPMGGHNGVTDCDIGDVGLLFHAAVGIWLGETGNNTIAHNRVHDLYYSGISAGWTWGYQQSGALNNLIEYNHIYNIGKGWLSDMSGIYTLGDAPGTMIRFNLIHDVRSDDCDACGIYYDEGSSSIVSEFNLVYRCQGRSFQQHIGRKNVIRNNIFAMALSPYQVCRALEGDEFAFERNIVTFAEGDLFYGRWTDGKYCFRGNLYWNACGRPLTFGNQWTWEEWRQRGQDDDSRIADPKFTDPQRGDFTLAADSPALQTGFIPFDLSTVGPRGQPGAALPVAPPPWRPETRD